LLKGDPQPIPVEQLPEGIELCLKNCERYFDESKLLEKNQRFQSSMLMMLLAMEEFVKCKLLLDHFKEKKSVSEEEVGRYFRDHKFRLGEFSKEFHNLLPGNPIKFPDNFFKAQGKFEQDYKKSMMYVDWLGYGWNDPLDFSELPLAMSPYPEAILKLKLESASTELLHLVRDLQQDPSFKLAQNSPRQDNPSLNKIKNFLKDYCNSEKIPWSIEFTPWFKKIEISIEPIKPEITLETCKEIEEKITKKYPDFKTSVTLKKL